MAVVGCYAKFYYWLLCQVCMFWVWYGWLWCCYCVFVVKRLSNSLRIYVFTSLDKHVPVPDIQINIILPSISTGLRVHTSLTEARQLQRSEKVIPGRRGRAGQVGAGAGTGRERKNNMNRLQNCDGRESNPGQLLGRQLCLPLYHHRCDESRCQCFNEMLVSLRRWGVSFIWYRFNPLSPMTPKVLKQELTSTSLSSLLSSVYRSAS